jgi:hypothetical protein
MPTALKLHRRQFILARRPHSIRPDWEHLDVGAGWLLSHDPELSLARTDQGLVAGHSVEFAGDGQPHRAGRFCVLAFPWLRTDPAGLFGLYFGTSDQAAGDFVTSSPALAEMLGAHNTPERRLVWSGMNWNPLPLSTLTGVRRLMRDQALDLSNLSVHFRPEASLPPLGDEQSALDTLCASLTGAMAALPNQGRPLLALTAGLDSRTLASALLSSGVKFECVTQVIDGRTSDVSVAHSICRHLGVKHHVVGPGRTDRGAVETWRRHTLGSYDDADNNVLLGADQYRFSHSETILIRGGIFEIGRRFYSSKLQGLTYENATGEALFRRFDRIATDTRAVDSLGAWLDWRRAHDNALDLADALYIDQRVGGWLAAIEHAMDLLPGRVFHPASSLPAMRALVTAGPDERTSGQLQRDAIGRMVPELLRFPLNPVSKRSMVQRLRSRASRAFSKLMELVSRGEAEFEPQ